LANTALNKIGGVTGVTAIAWRGSVKRDFTIAPDQRKDALIDAAGNIGSLFLLGTMGERHSSLAKNHKSQPANDAASAPTRATSQRPQTGAAPTTPVTLADLVQLQAEMQKNQIQPSGPSTSPGSRLNLRQSDPSPRRR